MFKELSADNSSNTYKYANYSKGLLWKTAGLKIHYETLRLEL